MKWPNVRPKAGRDSSSRTSLGLTLKLLEEALRQPGCIVCTALHASERRELRSFLYEGMMSQPVRQRFLEGGGFCPRHFWMANDIEDECWPAGGIGVAILCQDLVHRNEVRLQELTSAGGRAGLFGQAGDDHNDEPGHACIFCVDWRLNQNRLTETLEEMADSNLAYRITPDRICAWHAQSALKSWRDEGHRVWLTDLIRKQFSALRQDLQAFIRKHDYQHRNEPLGQEQDVVTRAITTLGGPEPEGSGGKNSKP